MMIKIIFGNHVLNVESTLKISELTDLVRKEMGFHSGYTRLEIDGSGLAAGSTLSDYLGASGSTELYVSVYNAPDFCCHGSPYDPETGSYLCGKC